MKTDWESGWRTYKETQTDKSDLNKNNQIQNLQLKEIWKLLICKIYLQQVGYPLFQW